MPRSIFRYIVVILFVIIFSFSFGYLRTLFSLKPPDPKIDNTHANKDIVKTQRIELKPGAKLIFLTHFNGCGHEEITEELLEDALFGFTKEELEENMKDWTVEYFSPEQVNLRREVNGSCSEHYYIGIYEGYVALFQGRPGFEGSLIEKTDIMADVLREDDRIILEKGLVIENKQEFLKIREGLTN